MRGVQQASNARIEPADFMHPPPTYFNDDGRLDPLDRAAPGAITHATPASAIEGSPAAPGHEARQRL
jgi:hypothetical protein